MDVSELESLLLGLLDGEWTSLTIGYNDLNACNYETVQQAVEAGGSMYNDGEEWVSEEEKVKAMETNSWWRAQWYPRTPVGFNTLSASSLPVLIEALKDHTSQ